MTSGGHSKEINFLCRSPVCDNERNFSSNTYRIKINLTQICMRRNELTSSLRRAKIRDLIEMSLGPFEYNTDSSWSASNLNQLFVVYHVIFSTSFFSFPFETSILNFNFNIPVRVLTTEWGRGGAELPSTDRILQSVSLSQSKLNIKINAKLRQMKTIIKYICPYDCIN